MSAASLLSTPPVQHDSNQISAAVVCVATQMSWAAQQHVSKAAPSHLQLPTGSTAAVNYGGAQPSAAVKMQEVFGLANTPLLGGHARVPLVLELLSPAGRPLQVRQVLKRLQPSHVCLP
eukprot:GHRQ01023625.1.p3 GENE.GHRQ01023625.1~~GHRQ01023625.1.p3  ORF type:complete len:119 (-),score=40.08 GHRQ01023625.1:717-1073(-)